MIYLFCISFLGFLGLAYFIGSGGPSEPNKYDKEYPISLLPVVEKPTPVSPKKDKIKNSIIEVPTDFDFIAIDFETANKKYNSACSLGIANVRGGKIESRSWLICPPTFDFEFTYIHGIRSEDVETAPTFDELWVELEPLLSGRIVVAHNAIGFDMRVLDALCEHYRLPKIQYEVLDTLDVAKKTWLGLPNYKLNTVCEHLGISLNHHEAESDAIAAARIVIAAKMNKPIPKPITVLPSIPTKQIVTRRKRQVTVEFQYFDETTLNGNLIVFTGDLDTMEREDAIAAAEAKGAIIRTAVSGKTNFLIVGTQTQTKYDKSSKELKAEALIAAGHNIVILDEDEFLELLN